MDTLFRVLMLEDNPADAKLNAEQLSDSGLEFTYHRVEKEVDFLRELQEFKPDIILADYRLPQFDCISALHLAHKRYPLIPFIIVSGAVGEEVAIGILKEGASDYIFKNNIARLGSAVINAIEGKRTKEDKAHAEEELRKSYQELAQMNKELQLEIITRRLAEEKLRKTGEMLEKIFSTTHICIVYLDKEFKFLKVNPAFAKECGHDEDFLVGKNYFTLYPDSKSEKLFRRTVETGEATSVFASPFEYIENPDREKTYWDWTITPVKDFDGSVKELIFILVNVTDRILTQDRIQESEKKYREMAERATRLASIGAVAGGITHEINQPLNAIKVSADGIIYWYQNHKGLVPEQFISMLGKISAGVNRINEIIKHMRTFWVTQDHGVKEEFDLNDITARALSLIMSQLSVHGIKTVIQLCEPAPLIIGNPIHVEQIVINLVTNAMNSLDNISDKDKSIVIKTARADDTWAKLMVIDNGIGLPEGIGERLFDPFYSTRKPGEGTGLGLSIVKQFVDEHKGSIEFENNPSGGAIFSIRFPLSQNTTITSKV
jgi:PAS domain S-box-containing protein